MPIFSPARLIRSFGYAWAGIAHVGRTQPNWRIHVTVAGLAFVLALALQISLLEWVALSLTIGLVLAFECLNTGVEAAVDALNAPPSLAAKRAKDAAAGSVLVMAFTSVVVGLLIFLPRILALANRTP